MDVTAIGCDVATTTGRKWLRGPRGTGLLYVRTGFAEQMSPPGVGGSAAIWEDAEHYSLRPGNDRLLEFEVPIAAHLGLGVAIDHALDIGVDAIAARVTVLAERLRQGLARLDGVAVHDGGRSRCGIVTFTSTRASPVEVKAAGVGRRRQCVGDRGPLGPSGHGAAPSHQCGPSLPPLLQHGGRARPPFGGGPHMTDLELCQPGPPSSDRADHPVIPSTRKTIRSTKSFSS